jgi:hypothetical protein
LIFKPPRLFGVVLDPKLGGTDVPTFNPPLCGELKATRSAGGRLVDIIYRISSDTLYLERTGSHSDLFK